MCGGFVMLVGGSQRPSGAAVLRQLVYATGRLFTYTFLGAMAGYAGMRLTALPSTLVDVQRIFSITAGVVMIAIGLLTIGVLRIPIPALPRIESLFVPVFRHFLGGTGGRTVFLAGLANGFLPCGLVHAFLAMSLAAAKPVHGALLMLAFGVGTVPAMTLLGCGSSFVAQHTRARVRQIAAVVVVLSGAVTVYRAIPAKHNCCDPASQVTFVQYSSGYALGAPRVEQSRSAEW
jgi:sulfite exporter TauE/SafE